MRLSIFDLDGTLLSVNSSLAFVIFLSQTSKIPKHHYLICRFLALLYRLHIISLSRIHKIVFSLLFCGKNAEEISSLVSSFLPTLLPKKLYTPALSRLVEAKKRRDALLILSSSPNFLVKPIATYLGAPFQSTEYAVDKEGNFCHISTLMTGNAKRQVLIQLQKTYSDISVYSDSTEDLPLLWAASHPVLVRPGFAMRFHCRKTSWEVI